MSKPKPVGRKAAYSEKGIGRVLCLKCGARKATQQFNVCALDGRFVPLCPECDVDLNATVLNWLGVSRCFDRMKDYRKRMGVKKA